MKNKKLDTYTTTMDVKQLFQNLMVKKDNFEKPMLQQNHSKMPKSKFLSSKSATHSAIRKTKRIIKILLFLYRNTEPVFQICAKETPGPPASLIQKQWSISATPRSWNNLKTKKNNIFWQKSIKFNYFCNSNLSKTHMKPPSFFYFFSSVCGAFFCSYFYFLF